MSLLHRKSLLAESREKFSSHCYMCYVCPEDCYIRSPPLDPPPSPSNGPRLSTILILMLCLLGLAFFILSYLTIKRYKFRLRISRQGQENGEFLEGNLAPALDHPAWFIRTVGLPQSAIESIPVFKFKKYENLIDGNDCSVCLSEFQEDEKIRLLPKCCHAFHLRCIDPWLRSHTNCPVCRALVIVGHENNIAVDGLLSTGPNQGQNRSETRLRTETEESREFLGAPGNNIMGRGNFRVLSDLADHWVKLDREFRAVRRTMSLDFSSEFMMNGRVEKVNTCKRSCKNSPGRFLQKGPISMKRSFSFSGKRSMRKNNGRSHEFVCIR